MELEIGMYVRTINGKIWIIKSQQAISGHRKDIINASYDIIDLIEVGDYVNGKLVAKNKEVITTDNIYIGRYLYEKDNSLISGEEDIKSIVTKEAFESMSYKVEE